MNLYNHFIYEFIYWLYEFICIWIHKWILINNVFIWFFTYIHVLFFTYIHSYDFSHMFMFHGLIYWPGCNNFPHQHMQHQSTMVAHCFPLTWVVAKVFWVSLLNVHIHADSWTTVTWKVGVCYILTMTYILCYVPPLFSYKTMQNI